MTSYNDQYEPPAPFSLITLRNIDTSETVRNVPMLLDTGSDITLLPLSYCKRIGILVSEERTLDLLGLTDQQAKDFMLAWNFSSEVSNFAGTLLRTIRLKEF